ncbi:MAG: GNAT family N-acetyltransferase [Proteobacteria bacterium]|nr:GNAT family N-acetyltransferase [Pseudomonadota bacterium]
MFEICTARSIKDPGFLPLLSQVFVEQGVGMPDKEAFDTLENAIKSGRVRYFMALESDRVVGVVSLTFGFSTVRMKPFALLSDLYVHPGHRGRGAAAALVVAAMDDAHRERCDYVSTQTAAGLEGIFERYGWSSDVRTMIYHVDLEGPPPSLKITGDFTFD